LNLDIRVLVKRVGSQWFLHTQNNEPILALKDVRQERRPERAAAAGQENQPVQRQHKRREISDKKYRFFALNSYGTNRILTRIGLV
jgi:hypothetical protein